MDEQFCHIRDLGGYLSSSSQPDSSEAAVSGIHTLPVELLIKIFYCVVYFVNIDVREGCMDIISISHVCRNWRSITLHAPRLWCNIWAPMQLIGVDKLVKRAKHSPLNIHCDVSYESDSLRIQMLITYIARRKIVRRWKNLRAPMDWEIIKGQQTEDESLASDRRQSTFRCSRATH